MITFFKRKETHTKNSGANEAFRTSIPSPDLLLGRFLPARPCILSEGLAFRLARRWGAGSRGHIQALL